MSDRRRIVTLSPAGAVTTVKDLEDSSTLFAVAGSFQLVAAARHTVMAGPARRYQGQRAAFETHDNASYTWKALVKATTPAGAVAAVEGALSVLEQRWQGSYFEWRPDGLSVSTYRELRGPATWTPTYGWAQFTGAQSFYVDISVPVEPVGRGDILTAQTISSTTMPAVISLGTAVAGDAPAFADVSLTTSGGSAAPIWAMIGWTKRPGSPLSGSVAPFGIIEAEAGASLTTWADTANAIYRGGHGLQATTSGPGSATAYYAVDPSVMQPDDFTMNTVDIEVWARYLIGNTVVLPRSYLSLQPAAGLSFGSEQFSAEYRSNGSPLQVPSAGNVFRATKLGTLTMPVDTDTPLKWNIKVGFSWGAGSSGPIGLDYLWLVPAKQRALSPSGEPNDAYYPEFIASTASTQKTIKGADLAGYVGSGTASQGRDSGLGGSPIEMPPGNVDMLIVLSSVVPDDPTVDASSMQISHTGVTGKVQVTPRYWMAKDS